jgi:hypothetical protein
MMSIYWRSKLLPTTGYNSGLPISAFPRSSKLTEKLFINEKALLYRLACPIRSNGSNTVQDSPVLVCAENTGRWLIAERFAGRAPTVSETREFYDIEWKQTAYSQSRAALHQRHTFFACGKVHGRAGGCAILSGVTKFSKPYPHSRWQLVAL